MGAVYFLYRQPISMDSFKASEICCYFSKVKKQKNSFGLHGPMQIVQVLLGLKLIRIALWQNHALRIVVKHVIPLEELV